MTKNNEITVVGNLTADPELRYTQNGLPVANLTIASTPREFDRATNQFKDGKTTFFRASVWRELAEHVAGSLTKGSQVIATGQIKQTDYQDREGNARTGFELEIDEIGVSLRWGTAQFTRVAKSDSANQVASAAPQVAAAAPVNQPAAPAQQQYAAPAAPAAPAPQPVGVGVAAGQALSDDAF